MIIRSKPACEFALGDRIIVSYMDAPMVEFVTSINYDFKKETVEIRTDSGWVTHNAFKELEYVLEEK